MFTQKITGADTFELLATEGFVWVSVSVESTSTTDATILGKSKLGIGTASNQATIEKGQSITVDTKGQYPIEFTLTIPSGCTVNIIAN